MTEVWKIRTSDGEEYNLHTGPAASKRGVDPTKIYNLQQGGYGQYGMPVTIERDKVPRVAGSEIRGVARDIRTIYLPIRVTGRDAADLSRNISRFRQSIAPENELQLWITNAEGITKVLYCRYAKGFETAADEGNTTGIDWKLFPLYLEADDPYWYDPPGGELSRNFSTLPWNSEFFTFNVITGFAQDAHIGDTRVTITDTSNFAPGKAVMLRGSKIVIANEIDVSEEAELTDSTAEPIPTNVYLAVSTETPQLNQPIQISGKVVDMQTGKGLADRIIELTRTFLGGGSNQTNTQTSTIVQTQTTGNVSGSGNVITFGSQSQSVTQTSTSVNICITDSKGNFNFTDILGLDGIFNYKAHFKGSDWSHLGPSGDSHPGPDFGHHGESEHSKTIRVGSTTATTLTLVTSNTNPGRNVQFKLYGLLTTSGKPIKNAHIRLYKSSPSGGNEIGQTATNSNGEYSFLRSEPVDSWCTYEVVFSGAGGMPDADIQKRKMWIFYDNLYRKMFDMYDALYARMYKLTHADAYLPKNNPFLNKPNPFGDYPPGGYAIASAKIHVKIGSPSYPINYRVALTPNQINDGEIQYFGNSTTGTKPTFNSVILIAESEYEVGTSGTRSTYAAERATIVAQGFTPMIDISVVTDKLAALSDKETWIQGLYGVGWRYFCGLNSKGRSGDPAYLRGLHSDINYINYNSAPRGSTGTQPDISGTGVYKNSFECMSDLAVSYIEQFTTAAWGATPSVKSGLLAPIIMNPTVNPMLVNSVADAYPAYRDILDWTYAESVGMDNFTVWFHPKYNSPSARDIVPEQLSIYKFLLFDDMLQQMQEAYPPIPISGAGWIEPTVKAVSLSLDYSLNPLTFTGVLTWIKDETPIPGAEIALQLHAYSKIGDMSRESTPLSHVSSASVLKEQKVILFDSTSGFIAGATVEISDSILHHETGVIATVAAGSITLVDNLTKDYNITTPEIVYPIVAQITIPAGQKVVPLNDTSGFIIGGDITISDAAHSETGVLTSIQTNASLTLTSNLTNSYSSPTVTQTSWPSGQKVIHVAQTVDFAVGNSIIVADTTNTEAANTIVSISGGALTLTNNLVHKYAMDATVNNTGSSAWRTIATTATDIDGKYSVNIGRVIKRSSDNAAKNQKIVKTIETNGFIVGSHVKISDALHSEIGVIASITTNTSITLVSNLTQDYITPLITAYNPPGEHWYRVYFAGGSLGGKTYMSCYTPTDDGIQILHLTDYETLAISQANTVASVDSPTVLTLNTPLSEEYLVSNECYITETDMIDTFLNPTDTVTRTMSNGIELVVFWLRGCPPCYGVKNQVSALQTEFANISTTFVEIEDHWADPITHLVPPHYNPVTGALLVAEHSAIDEMGYLNIGMDDAAVRYPMAYNFALKCGPFYPKPSVIGGIMPAVLCVYRDGLFIKAWCGVHTTGIDPVSKITIQDTCGPRLTWKFGTSYIANKVIIINRGDDSAYPVWTITGPGRWPTFKNITTGESISLDYDLIAGETVVLDTREFAHTCYSTRSSSYTGTGYMESVTCPTCKGKGAIPSSCENCGGSEICPTCHGSGTVNRWVVGTLGTTSDVSGMYNLRYAIDINERYMWGFAPGANIIEVEMGVTEYGKSNINMTLMQRFEGA